MAHRPNQSLSPVLQLQLKQWRVFCLEDLRWKTFNSQTVHVAHTNNLLLKRKQELVKRTAEHGIASTVHYFNKVFSDHVVKESSVAHGNNVLAKI